MNDKTNNILFEEYDKKLKKYKVQKNILVIIIVLLLLCILTCYAFTRKPKNQDILLPAFNETVKVIEINEKEESEENIKLNIFSNKVNEDKALIAPTSRGQYKFIVKNNTNKVLKYNLSFSDEMSNKVNMKYRLKINNIYIRGTEANYITIKDLNVEEIVVMENSNNLYTLEWYWEDNDVDDNYIGSLNSDEIYTLNLEIKGEELINENNKKKY